MRRLARQAATLFYDAVAGDQTRPRRQDLCTGDGLCVDVVPGVFMLLEDGIAYVCEQGVVLNDPGMAESQAAVPEEHEKAVVRAALICPGECIFIERDDLS